MRKVLERHESYAISGQQIYDLWAMSAKPLYSALPCDGSVDKNTVVRTLFKDARAFADALGITRDPIAFASMLVEQTLKDDKV